MKIHVPPIKCQGIKTRLVGWITSCVERSSAGRWIEPFTGSGVIGFNLRPDCALFADINPHIISFYNAVKSGYVTPTQARSFLEQEGAFLSQKGAAHYYAVRDRFNALGDPYDFLFLSRACFNGLMRFNRQGHYNVPFGHKPERFSRAYITRITNQIAYVASATQQFDWTFVCTDFRMVMAECSNQDFLYCDPPYAGRHTDYFNAWSDQEEQALGELLATTPAKFILSTWHSNKYRQNTRLEQHFSQFCILTRPHFYHVGASEKNRNAVVEALVLNYTPASAH